MSFTISYSNPPCNGQDLLNNTSPSFIGGQDNNFTVSQTMAGVVNSGSESCASLSVSGTSNFTGISIFTSPPIMSGSSISSNTIPSLSIVNKSIGDAQITLSSIGQSSISSGYVDLVNAQTKAGILTFTSPPIMSGSSISSNTIPSLSIVNKSISDAQITLSGIGQSSISSGYVDLSSGQTIAGIKTFNGVCSFTNGVSASTFTGSLSGNATTATLAQTVNILTDNTAGTYYVPFLKSNVGSDSLFVDDVSVPILSYNPSTGSLTSGSLLCSAGITGAGLTSSNGLVVSSGNISLQSGIILPTSQTVLTIVAGVVTVNLNNLSLNEFILPSANFTSNITSFVFTNGIVNSKFYIYIQGAANRTVNKNLGVGQVNTLSGNTQIASGSTWRVEGTVLSATLTSLQWINFT